MDFNQKMAQDKLNSFKYSEKDKLEVMQNKDKIISIMGSNGSLNSLVNDVLTMFNMLKDTFSGSYKEVPFGVITAIIGSLAYLLSPVDMIPDCIPVLGYIDDAAVIRACMEFIKHDINKYRNWNSRQR